MAVLFSTPWHFVHPRSRGVFVCDTKRAELAVGEKRTQHVVGTAHVAGHTQHFLEKKDATISGRCYDDDDDDDSGDDDDDDDDDSGDDAGGGGGGNDDEDGDIWRIVLCVSKPQFFCCSCWGLLPCKSRCWSHRIFAGGGVFLQTVYC